MPLCAVPLPLFHPYCAHSGKNNPHRNDVGACDDKINVFAWALCLSIPIPVAPSDA